jgi:hypothetical protein
MDPLKGILMAIGAAIFAPIAYLFTALFGIGIYIIGYMVMFFILTGLFILFFPY